MDIARQLRTGASRGVGFLRLDRHEIAGSLGDLGTFIPLFVGMVVVNGLSAASVLVFAGLFNIITGIVFGIPMPVQPMKAIATVALTEALAPGEIYAAGILVSVVIFLIGITGLVQWLNRWIPTVVVKGLQVSLGIKLMIMGWGMVKDTHRWWGTDSIGIGILAGVIGLLLMYNRKVPSAPVLFGLGLVATAVASPALWGGLRLSFDLPSLTIPTVEEFATGAVKGAIPQIPLTLLNSVIAVCALSWALFPDRGADTKRVAVSVGMMNLVGCWFGAMPMCHGSGGLAGQHFFGARTGNGVVFLGLIKLALGLFAGAAALTVLLAYPTSVLGVLLMFAAIELALVALDVRNRRDGLIMLMTAGAILGLESTLLGFLVGLVVSYLTVYAFRRAGLEEGAS
ncbi:MAG: sulfate transporter [Chloroflexi bacterium]|nr:sulfate transporter [Chloroflexota bacterium]